jgi:glucose-1-phosphate thymidylyltransferase
MKGIVLAGGAGSRLHPVTRAVSKQLLPVYDKPMIYYPLSALMLAGIRDILVITTPEDRDAFRRLLGDGSPLGIKISYAVQPRPEGLAQAFVIGGSSSARTARRSLSATTSSTARIRERAPRAAMRETGATVFAYRVRDPERYGVVAFDASGRAVEIEEKPKAPRSPYAVTGLYFYDNRVVDIAAGLAPSARGEIEITDVNRAYLKAGDLHVEVLGRGFAWLDTGTVDSLLQASNFIQTLQERQGLQVACLEEVAFKMGFLDAAGVRSLAEALGKSAYADYLRRMLEEDGV